MSGEHVLCEYPGGQINTEIPGCESPEVVESGIGTAISVKAPKSDSLPITGGDVLGLAGIGLFCIIVGRLMIQRARRRIS